MSESPPDGNSGRKHSATGAWWREEKKPSRIAITLPPLVKKLLAPKPQKKLKPFKPKFTRAEIRETKRIERAKEAAELEQLMPKRVPKPARARSGKQLIVTADDFGASTAVNEAVERAHREGILTAASLMVAGDAAADAVTRAKAMPELGVGLHIVLVEGKPILPADQVPDLIDAEGNFRTDMALMGAEIFFRDAVRAQVYDEIEAQFEAFVRTGLTLDHVNAHKHFHLHPTIAGLILEIGDHYGLRSARAPVEPLLILNAIEPTKATFTGRLAGYYARSVAARMRRMGVTVPDQVFGIAWSGAFTRDRLAALLDRLPEGLSEIYMHPATSAYPGSAPDYLYAEELAALTDPAILAETTAKSIALGNFTAFAF